MNFPLLEQRESEINIWLKDIRSKEKWSKVGFLTENNIQK
jgi:hypothetical protein